MSENKNNMELNSCNLRAYKHYLESIPLNRIGIERLKQVASCPDGKIVDDVQPIFGAFCEFVTFNECVRRPFFKILDHILNSRIVNLFSVLLVKNQETDLQLTYEEAFDLFLFLGESRVRSILDVYKFSSITYNGVLDALKAFYYKAFVAALGNADYRDMMSALKELRYILLGKKNYEIDLPVDSSPMDTWS